jgi:hypothetical protein
VTDQAAWSHLLHTTSIALGFSREPTKASFNSAHVLALAERHGVTPLIASSPKALGRFSQQATKKFQVRAAEAATASLAQLGQLSEILGLFESRGIPAVSFKGPALSTLAYGDPARRASVDIDILVPRSQVARCVVMMAESGYEGPGLLPARLDDQIRVGREFKFVGPDRAMVEIQWAFAPSQDALRLTPGGLQRQWLAVGGLQIPTFEAPDLLVALCVHAARERWWRVLWTADVAALMAKPDMNWDRVAQLSDDTGVARITQIGLSLARRLLGAPLPGFLDRWMRKDSEVPVWVDRLCGDVAPTPPVEGGSLEGTLIGLHDRRIDDARSAARWIFTPTEADFRAVQLPDRLSRAYAMVRPMRLAGNLRRRPAGPQA